MADHYVALNDGVEGFRYSDFIVGTANTVGVNQVELRVQDGTNLTRKDMHNLLAAFERFFQNPQQVVASGFQNRKIQRERLQEKERWPMPLPVSKIQYDGLRSPAVDRRNHR